LILEISAVDLEFSGIKLQSGSFSKEDVLLQVGILSMLASDLVYMPKEEGGEQGKEGGDDDFEDEDEMDYDEENGDGGAEFGGDFNDNENDIDGEQQDEAALMSNFKMPI
jgi:hypothetical protein